MTTLTRYSILLLLGITSCTIAFAQKQYSFLRGLVVDEEGRPAVRASVSFDMSDYLGIEKCVHDAYEMLTDAGGQFFNNIKCKSGKGKTIIFVESAIDLSTAQFPISAPFWPELRRNNPKFAGMTVEINGNQNIDLGKIPIQVWYNGVELFVTDKSGKPYYESEDDWGNFILIVRDQRGDAVGSEALSINDTQRSVRLDRGSVKLALPEGTWTLELLNSWDDFDQKGRTLRKLAATGITVKRTDVCIQAKLTVK